MKITFNLTEQELRVLLDIANMTNKDEIKEFFDVMGWETQYVANKTWSLLERHELINIAYTMYYKLYDGIKEFLDIPSVNNEALQARKESDYKEGCY